MNRFSLILVGLIFLTVITVLFMPGVGDIIEVLILRLMAGQLF
ncbi:MAG: hypothetical protein P8N40_00225 [Gammaproteobacteria bacterium]|jgi:hypothetical protein|nr:hypothetical protein [Gammaproteobacteria bacterium]